MVGERKEREGIGGMERERIKRIGAGLMERVVEETGRE